VLRLSDEFPAKAELEALLQACADAWPTYRKRTQAALTSKCRGALSRSSMRISGFGPQPND